MKCPKCGKELDGGRAGPRPKYYWAGCDSCGFYTSAATLEELKKRIEPAEVQEISPSDVGKLEDIL